MKSPLPVDPFIPAIIEAVRKHRAAVIVAPPGAGKTTRIAPALVSEGPVILLQPRRVAARILARRIAEEQGWRVGEEVGWQVRFERRFSERTRLLVATEGILTARLRSDPLLSEFKTAILDEFHERSIHADVAFALVREAMESRGDLRLIVMSATIDPLPISRFLGDAPIIEIPGRVHPIDIRYQGGDGIGMAAATLTSEIEGDVLCFLPGVREIDDASSELARMFDPSKIDVIPLHGSLSAEEQDAALRPSVRRRKIILATNIAETSITVEGVRAVIDSGLHKTLRYDTATGIDHLTLERIPADSAEQRAGRAGRLAPGIAIRLWNERDILEPHRTPEIDRVDLASPLLEVIAWGGDPSRFRWFDPPEQYRVDAAMSLLEMLGAIENGRLTPIGSKLLEIPLHPRLGRLLLSGFGSRRAAIACALLSDGIPGPLRAPIGAATESDLLVLIDRFRVAPPHLQRTADELAKIGQRLSDDLPRSRTRSEGEIFLRAVLSAFPDRVARRREPKSDKLLLASGHGAQLARESGVKEGEFLVAVEVTGRDEESLVRLASRIEKAWLENVQREVVHRIDPTGVVRASELTWYQELALGDRPVAVDADEARRLIRGRLEREYENGALDEMKRRAEFAGIELPLEEIFESAAEGRTSFANLRLEDHVPFSIRREIDRLAPDYLVVPSGRRVRLEYQKDGTVTASVKLQELFGLAESPRLGTKREPVTFSLLSPAGRPVQTTRDLRSFWENTYPEVRKELRGRYPKHPWPEDPWNATPTARAKPRGT